MQTRKYRNYDPEIKGLVIKSGSLSLAKKYDIPRNTARYWIEKSKPSKKITSKEFKVHILKQEFEKEIQKERAKLNLVLEFMNEIYLIKLKKQLTYEQKKKIISRIENLKSYIKVSESLKLIGICKSSYTRWRNLSNMCPLSKMPKCIKSISKNQLTKNEVEVIQKLCTQRKYKYLTLTSLYKTAIRNNLLFCSKEKWFKYIHKLGLFKIRQKTKSKKKYKVGIRAQRPNEIWHIDVTEIKTRDGCKYYLQAIIDNYSRRVLSWSIAVFFRILKSNYSTKNALKNLYISITPKVINTTRGKKIGNIVDIGYLASSQIQFLNFFKIFFILIPRSLKFSKLHIKKAL